MSETTVVDSKLDKLEQNNRRVEADAPMSNLEAPYVVGMLPWSIRTALRGPQRPVALLLPLVPKRNSDRLAADPAGFLRSQEGNHFSNLPRSHRAAGQIHRIPFFPDLLR